jgi:hypothetical protein
VRRPILFGTALGLVTHYGSQFPLATGYLIRA